MTFNTNNQIHHYNTRISPQFHLPRVNHPFAKNFVKYSVPMLIDNAPACIKEKLYTSSRNGVTYNNRQKW